MSNNEISGKVKQFWKLAIPIPNSLCSFYFFYLFFFFFSKLKAHSKISILKNISNFILTDIDKRCFRILPKFSRIKRIRIKRSFVAKGIFFLDFL